jgi:23S rRNA (guanosine2251-2'-O)-methyltransferase
VALAEKFTYSELDHLANISFKKKGEALIIALDHITDEGNLGALIRTAAFFGAHGLIIPKDRSASVTAKVLKRSSGACIYLPIARVVNMGRALDLLEKKGCWIIGASGESKESIYEFDWNRDLVLVLGNEQRGLSRSVRKRCHQEVSIPSLGHAESLNVSVASGVILSEIIRQRNAAGS